MNQPNFFAFKLVQLGLYEYEIDMTFPLPVTTIGYDFIGIKWGYRKDKGVKKMVGVVEIQNVSKIIKGKTIIDSLSFEVNRGEVFGFLGPNGAGKTTTIRMIVSLMGISSGDIKISGFSVKNNFEKAISQVGAIVENPELYKFLMATKIYCILLACLKG